MLKKVKSFTKFIRHSHQKHDCRRDPNNLFPAQVEYAVIQEEMNLREMARDDTSSSSFSDIKAQNEELKK